MLHKLIRRHQLKYKICISGAAETGHCAIDAVEKAEETGREIARRGMVLVTGATVGIPYWAAKGAKEEGGIVIGFSPAASELAHKKTYKLPTDYHDVIVYTGFEYSGRNLILTRSCDALINICGRMGTLNEFTIAFEDEKPIGVLEGTGGTADEIKSIVEKMHRGPGSIVYDKDPKGLLDKIENLLAQHKSGKKVDRYVRG
ncbi:MAG TPA: hypothetical protein VJH70_03175 [Candidatus Paceibacterota bacterium]